MSVYLFIPSVLGLLLNHKNKGFSSNTGPDPNRNCEASIQCWAFIGMQAKRHLLAGR